MYNDLDTLILFKKLDLGFKMSLLTFAAGSSEGPERSWMLKLLLKCYQIVALPIAISAKKATPDGADYFK